MVRIGVDALWCFAVQRSQPNYSEQGSNFQSCAQVAAEGSLLYTDCLHLASNMQLSLVAQVYRLTEYMHPMSERVHSIPGSNPHTAVLAGVLRTSST